MEQAGSKHGPRLDQQLAGDVCGGTQGEDQPDATSRSRSTAVSRLGRYIGLAALPGDREALRRSAAMLNAPDDIIAALDRLPHGVVFDTVAEVQHTLDGAGQGQPPGGAGG